MSVNHRKGREIFDTAVALLNHVEGSSLYKDFNLIKVIF